MRTPAVALAAILSAILIVAGPLSGPAAGAPPLVWPGDALGVADLTGGSGYHRPVAAAIRAWNRAGVGIRLQPVSDGPGVLRVVFARGRCLSGVAGEAPDGFVTGAATVVVRDCPQAMRALLVAHELGRALGVPVSDARCSLMNSRGTMNGDRFAVPVRCSPLLPPAWLSRLVDPWSAALARSLYLSPVGPQDVALVPAPAPEVTWRSLTRAKGVATVVLRGSPRCPTEHDLARATLPVLYRKPAYAGLHRLVDTSFPAAAGRYCYGVFTVSPTGRATRHPGLVSFDVAAPGVTAAFSFAPDPGRAGQAVSFRDDSTAAGTSVTRRRWDFGDPGSGSANVIDTTDPAAGAQVQHVYAAPGAYAVTLTVVATAGAQSSVTRTVTVVGG